MKYISPKPRTTWVEQKTVSRKMVGGEGKMTVKEFDFWIFSASVSPCSLLKVYIFTPDFNKQKAYFLVQCHGLFFWATLRTGNWRCDQTDVNTSLPHLFFKTLIPKIELCFKLNKAFTCFLNHCSMFVNNILYMASSFFCKQESNCGKEPSELVISLSVSLKAWLISHFLFMPIRCRVSLR